MAAKRKLTTALCAALLTVALTAGVAQAQPMSAHGSAEQAYAVGLRANRTVTLLNAHGRKVAAQKADSLGGVVFRNVTPGKRLPDAPGRRELPEAERVQRPPGTAEHQDL